MSTLERTTTIRPEVENQLDSRLLGAVVILSVVDDLPYDNTGPNEPLLPSSIVIDARMNQAFLGEARALADGLEDAKTSVDLISGMLKHTLAAAKRATEIYPEASDCINLYSLENPSKGDLILIESTLEVVRRDRRHINRLPIDEDQPEAYATNVSKGLVIVEGKDYFDLVDINELIKHRNDKGICVEIFQDAKQGIKSLTNPPVSGINFFEHESV